MPVGAMLHHNLPHIRDMAIGEFLSYLIFGLLFFVVLAWMRHAGVFRFRIRSENRDKAGQIGREAANSARSILIFNGVQIATRIAALAFGFIMTFETPIPLWQAIISFPLVMIGHDAYFYWLHRFMHLPAVFKPVHREHHKSAAPTVFTAYSLSLGEAFLQGIYPILFVTVFPCNFWTLIFFQFVEIAHNVAIHSGLDVFPRPLVVGRRFGWLCGAVYHDMHHGVSIRHNYGLYSRFWDRLMKTEHPDFVRIYEYVHSRGNDGRAYGLLAAPAKPAPMRAERVLEPAEAG